MKTLALLVLVISAAFAVAQEHPSVAAQPNTVYVGADGKFEAAPDTAVIEFNISAQENSAHDAYDRASRSAEQLREILRGNGIDPKTAKIGYYSLQPVYDYKNPKRKLVGYRVESSVSLKLKDFTKVAPIIQQLADADITDTHSVNYILDDMDAAKSKAVEDAYRRARQSADAVAHASGRAVGQLSYASVDVMETPRAVPMFARAMAMHTESTPAPTEEFSPQTVSITAHVNAVFNLQ
jgi:uncharacterized protein YggE